MCQVGIVRAWGGRMTAGYSSVPRDAQWVRLVLDIGEEPITILLEREEDGP